MIPKYCTTGFDPDPLHRSLILTPLILQEEADVTLAPCLRWSPLVTVGRLLHRGHCGMIEDYNYYVDPVLTNYSPGAAASAASGASAASPSCSSDPRR